MIALLAIAAAAGWGTSDFVAGISSRRSTALSVVTLTHLTALALLAVLSLGVRQGGIMDVTIVHFAGHRFVVRIPYPSIGIVGAPGAADLLWGVLAGLGGGVGALFLYLGLARGTMSVVAPLTAATAATLPVVAGVLGGDVLPSSALVGIVLALGAIVLVSSVPATPGSPVVARAPAPDRPRRRLAVAAAASLGPCVALGSLLATPVSDGAETLGGASTAFGAVVTIIGGVFAGTIAWRPRRHRPLGRHLPWSMPGVGLALASGAGFAAFYICAAHTEPSAGLWTMVSARGASVVMFVLMARLRGERALPTAGARRGVVVAGALDALAAAAFLAAAHAGTLSVVSVLSSMYPAATVLLALAITRERCSAKQLTGLALALAAVGLFAIG